VSAPWVTVVVPTHERAGVLPATLESLRAQTFTDLEVVVADDGSTDDTAAAVRTLGDPRVHYDWAPRAGATAARNRGAGLARGRYLAFLDSDDEAFPTWLERLHAAAVADPPEPEVVCCGVTIREAGRDRVRLPGDLGATHYGYAGLFLAGSFLVRRDCFEVAGGYAEDFPAGQQRELALRITRLAHEKGWRFAAVPEPLVRIHRPPQRARIRGNDEAVLEGALRTVARHRTQLDREPGAVANAYATAGFRALRLGRRRQACDCFLRALRADPRRPRHYLRFVAALAGGPVTRLWLRRSAPDLD